MKTKDKVILDYLRFKIGVLDDCSRQCIHVKSSGFYNRLRQDADRYNVSVLDVLRRDAYYVMKGEFISLLK